MKPILKRFRFTLYFMILLIIAGMLDVAKGAEDDMYAALCGMALLCTFGAYVWALYRAAKDVYYYARGYSWPKDEPCGEFQVFVKLKRLFQKKS